MSTDNEIIQFFSRHLVGMCVEYESLKSDGSVHHHGYTVLTGFCVEFLGMWYWVTAGHCLTTDLDERIERKELRVLSTTFVDYFGPDSGSKVIKAYPHTYEPGEAYSFYEPDVGLDVAFLPLTILEQRAFEANGVVPFYRETWINQHDVTFGRYWTLGFPVDRMQDIEDDGIETLHTSSAMYVVEPIQRDTLKDPPSENWFLARIHPQSNIPDIAGVSGGPILGFRKLPDGRTVYQVVAIQSTWRAKERVIYGCSFPHAAEMFYQRFLRSNAPHHPHITPFGCEVLPGIYVESRRKKQETIQRQYPCATIIDVTSKGEKPWVKFSPFYPHGDIPIPGTDKVGQSVEGIWQGLKVFEKEGVDPSKWAITNMKGIKRSGASRGKVLGHQFGSERLGYLEARKKIYLPCYRWVLENKLKAEIHQLHLTDGDIVLLDYETNGVLENLKKPLSHASLIAMFVHGVWHV